jgi:cytochrome c-type biogenesis protein CcmF
MAAVTIGVWALWVAVVAGALAALGARRPRVALPALATAAAATAVAVWVLAEAFWSKDFTVAYVVDHARRRADGPTRVSGVWGGMGGSLLVFALGTVLVGLVASVRAPEEDRARVAALVGGITACLVACVAVLSDPFERLAVPAVDGLGLTPILEHPAMTYHPPLVYAGLTSLTGAAALTVAALSRNRLDDAWATQVRRWLLVPWILLAIGMLAGAHWAYVELGWGGYWAWDPVENTALLPWLAVTAAVHGLQREGGVGASRRLVVAALVGSALLLALLGGLLTRSGATESVHAFAEEPAIGRAFAALLAVGVVGFGWLVLHAAREGVPSPVASGPRGAALRLQVVLIGSVLFVVLVGSTWPLVRELVGARPSSVAGSFYAPLVGPIALVLLTGMAVGPALGRRPLGRVTLVPAVGAAIGVVVAGLAGWTSWFALGAAATGGAAVAGSVRELVRARAPVGSHVAHLGAALLLLGVAGTSTGSTEVVSLAVGATADVAGRTVHNGGAEVVADPGPGTEAVVATIAVDGHVLRPQLVVHRARGRLLAESALRSTPVEDVQVMLRDARPSGAVVLQVGVHPLQQLVWWGALVLVLGGGLAFARGVSRRPRRTAPPPWPLPDDAVASPTGTPGSHPDVAPPPAPTPDVPVGTAPSG